MSVITNVATEAPVQRVSRIRPLVRAGALGGVAGSVATMLVAAVARAADVSLEIDGEAIPIAGFATMTLLGALLGVGLAFALKQRGRFIVVCSVLTAASVIPSIVQPDDTANRGGTRSGPPRRRRRDRPDARPPTAFVSQPIERGAPVSSASEVRESESPTGQRAATRMGPKPALTLERIADAAVAIARRRGHRGGVDAACCGRVRLHEDVALPLRHEQGRADRGDDRPGRRNPSRARLGSRLAPARSLDHVARRDLAVSSLAALGDDGRPRMGPNEIGWIERAIETLSDTLLRSEQMAVVLLICGHIRNTQSAATAGTQPWSGGRPRARPHPR